MVKIVEMSTDFKCFGRSQLRNENMKFIANLNGTILCPYQILADITAQIPDCPPNFKSLVFAPICDLNSTNDWINLESLGQPVTIRAKAISDAVCSLLKKQNINQITLELVITNGTLASDNLFCLLYLAESLQAVEITFYAENSKLTYLQTLIEPLASKANTTIYFKSNDLLSESIKNSLTELATHRNQSIKALGFDFDEHCFNKAQLTNAELNQFIGYSWMCLKSGGHDIACQLLEKASALTGLDPAMQEQLFMHLLMMRFFSHQYALIAESAFPEQFTYLESSEVNTLQFLTAYSATLSRNLNVAQRFFTKCNINENMLLTDEQSLYQMNLFALSKVLQGEIDTAFALEFRIKSFIEEQNIETVGLKYVNFINIARLYKKIKDFELSREYYNKAYNEISGGGYANSDHIYYNMNLGSLCEAAGDNKQALHYWIRAASHWLACTNKYELSWRPRLILCSEKISDIAKPLPIEKAHSFLLNKIDELIQACSIELPPQQGTEYLFITDASNIKKENCFINNNIFIYTGRIESIAPAPNKSTPEQRLAGRIAQCLNSMMDIPEDQNVLIIDTHLDTTSLNSPEEAIAFANLASCSTCYYNGQWLALNEFKALKPMTVSLAKAIHSIAKTDRGLTISYKRSFLNKTILDKNEIDWVNQLQESDALSLAQRTPEDLNTVHKLAKKRILNFSYPT